MSYFTTQLLLLLFSFAVGVVSAWKGLFSKEENSEKRKIEQRLAVVGVVFLTMILFGQGYLIVDKYVEASELDREKKLLEQLTRETFRAVPEASGGVVIGEYAYLVSDERAKLFRTKYNPVDKRYSDSVEEIDLYFRNPSETDKDKSVKKSVAPVKTNPKPGKSEKPESQSERLKLNKDDDVDDLEGAAFYNNKIYLVTSHSNNKNGNAKPVRQRFLEIDLITVGEKNGEPQQIAVVTRWADLRGALAKSLFESGSADRFNDRIGGAEIAVEMEIEGLAINPKTGTVYLGFRGPGKKNHTDALIAKAELEAVFAPGNDGKWKPQPGVAALSAETPFEIIPVNIGNDPNDRRGIVDMLYYNDGLLLLTNSLYKDVYSRNVELRRWTSGNDTVKTGKSFYESPLGARVKPETLLLPANPADKVFLFLDGMDVGGGQRVYDRKKDLNLD